MFVGHLANQHICHVCASQCLSADLRRHTLAGSAHSRFAVLACASALRASQLDKRVAQLTKEKELIEKKMQRIEKAKVSC